MLLRLIALVFLVQPLFAQDAIFRAPVAQVSSGGENGAAVSIGSSGGSLYLLTALHVIEDPENISINLWQWPVPLKGKVVNSDASIDLAVITCGIPEGYQPKYVPLYPGLLSGETPVVVVGHPNDNQWDISQINRIKATNYEAQSDKFTLYPVGLGPGSSGGPVLTQDGALLGLVLKIDNVNGVCLKATACKSACTRWGIPLAGGARVKIPKMVPIEGGDFTMGSNERNDEGPVRQVTVSTFYLSATEVTFEQYDDYCQKTGRPKPQDFVRGRGDRPVVGISWEEAVDYCDWLSSQTGETYRLPTEAEWEYAAGGGAYDRTTYPGTNSISELHHYGWIGAGAAGSTHPVAELRPNRLGLYDMCGNVWEFTSDWYADRYSALNRINPKGPGTGENKVSRGGSFYSGTDQARVAYRGKNTPYYNDHQQGIRLARSVRD